MREKGRTTEQVNIIRMRSIPGEDGLVGLKGQRIVAVLFNERTGQKREVPGHNLITTAGDVYYAEAATTKTPTNTFNHLVLSTEATAVAKTDIYGTLASYIAGSSAAVETGYPAQNDTDGDNSGSGATVVSWKFSYTKAAFNSGVVSGVIATTGATSASPVLTHFIFGTTFAKTSDDTLTVFVNHTFLGTT